MKPDKITQLILSKRDDLIKIDSFFINNHYNHILTGICCEHFASKLNLWKFRYPLYVKFQCLTLEFSDIVFEGINIASTEEINSTISHCLDIIDDEDIRSPMQLDDFYFYLEKRNINSINFKKTIAYTLVMMGKKKQAKIIINELIELIHDMPLKKNWMHDILCDCEKLITYIDMDTRKANNLVLSWENEMKQNIFGHI